MQFEKMSWKYFILPFFLSISVLYVSLSPLAKLPEVQFIALDKLGHLLAFLLLMMSYLWAFQKQYRSRDLIKTYVLISFVICVFLGGIIELLQHYLPIQRYGDWYDFYFDIAGVLLGLLIFSMLRKTKLLALLLVFSNLTMAQTIEEANLFQQELNAEFTDPAETILDSVDQVHFTHLDFFPVDEKFIIEARLIKQNSPIFFGMETTTDRKPEYRIWAYAYFTFEGKEHKLTIYQNKKLMNTLDYGDYLFLPFEDLSNGKSTYGGGRYVDLRTVEGDLIIIDFNKAYNPYCAYSDRFSCPKVPKENRLNITVNAGVKKFH